MIRRSVGVVILLALASCRSYDYASPMSNQGGLTPPDQFARYGKEQAQAVAIGREFGRTGQPDSAVAYAKRLPDVADVVADTQSPRLTVRFKSGWRDGIAPIADGKSGAETLK